MGGQRAVAGTQHSGDLVVVGRHSADEQAARRAEPGAAGQLLPPVGTPWSFSSTPPHALPAATGPTVTARFEEDGQPLPDASTTWVSSPEATSARIHTGPAAADLTRRAGAEAVTVGRDIAFAPGRFDPHSGTGRRRIAHELAHVAQQAHHTGRPVVHRDGDKPVSTPSTLAGLPESDRKQLQVVSVLPIEAKASGQLKGAFEAASISSPADEVVADASVPTAVARGLKNLAGDWSSGKKPSLKPNQTVTLDLDLTPYKGGRGLYRFTWTKPAPAKKGGATQSRILIEHLGQTPAPAAAKSGAGGTSDQATKPAKDPIDTKITDARLDISGYSKKEEPVLREAIATVPASHLAIVEGLKFRRGSVHPEDPKVAGHYDEDKHTVVMFDVAFTDTQVAFGDSGTATSYAARQIVHEIGHAVDLAPLRAAEKKTSDARADLNAKAGEFSSKQEADAYKAAKKALATAEEEQKAALGRSGTRIKATKTKNDQGIDVTATSRVIGTAHKGVKFREAVKGDGKDVSKYAETDWQESYAEAYALYLTQPSLLKQIRPKTYDHLSQTLPK